jgi:hypothetical protein
MDEQPHSTHLQCVDGIVMNSIANSFFQSASGPLLMTKWIGQWSIQGNYNEA